MLRLMICFSIVGVIALLTAGHALADSQVPESPRESIAALPTPTPWPTPTPMPTVVWPDPLTSTLVMTYGTLYYENRDLVTNTVGAIVPALDEFSSTVGSLESGMENLGTIFGISGGDEPGGDDPGVYDGMTIVELASAVITDTSTTLTWLRAVGEISILGSAVDFLLLSLAFILVVVVFKAFVKIILAIIGVIFQFVGLLGKAILLFL